MADQDPKKEVSIPAWQKVQKSEKSSGSLDKDDTHSTSQSHSPETSTSTSNPTLLEQAQTFLEDENIKDAPRERKVTFLEKKGLQSDDIQKLLGPDSEAHRASESQTELKTIHDSNDTSASAQNEPQFQQQFQTVQSKSSSSPAVTAPNQRDNPPIITYPEFLLKPQKPPPLVTIERIINAAYIFAGISAITYGTSKYLVEPMLESLTEARHELAEQAKSDLLKLNTKLESSVSHIPYIPTNSVLNSQKSHDRDQDTDSIDSDPTELFHRDIATQTSPEPCSSTKGAISSTNDLQSNNNNNTNTEPKDPITQQQSRLNSLLSSLSSILQSTETSTPAESRLKQTSTDFQAILDKIESKQFHNLTSSSSSSSTRQPWTSDNTNTDQSSYLYGGGRTTTRKTESGVIGNEAAKFKAEIRALKGVFLSSRNFPTAKPVASSISSPR